MIPWRALFQLRSSPSCSRNIIRNDARYMRPDDGQFVGVAYTRVMCAKEKTRTRWFCLGFASRPRKCRNRWSNNGFGECVWIFSRICAFIMRMCGALWVWACARVLCVCVLKGQYINELFFKIFILEYDDTLVNYRINMYNNKKYINNNEYMKFKYRDKVLFHVN